MATYSDGIRACGSCALWGGAREPEGRIFPAALVRVDNDERGKCMGGGYTGSEMRAIQSCGSWQLWPGLKKFG
jgi:hypothetical protein